MALRTAIRRRVRIPVQTITATGSNQSRICLLDSIRSLSSHDDRFGQQDVIDRVVYVFDSFPDVEPGSPISGFSSSTAEGHVIFRHQLAPRPNSRKGKTSKRTLFIRSLIREVAGFVPYEKRITELLKVGKDKRVLKVSKRKLGTHKRAKRKRDEPIFEMVSATDGYID